MSEQRPHASWSEAIREVVRASPQIIGIVVIVYLFVTNSQGVQQDLTQALRQLSAAVGRLEGKVGTSPLSLEESQWPSQ